VIAVEFAECVRSNRDKLIADLKSHRDSIVCGSGFSGSVAVRRLAESPDDSVLLREASGTDKIDLITNPNRWPMRLGSEFDWGFLAEPNSRLNGIAIPIA